MLASILRREAEERLLIAEETSDPNVKAAMLAARRVPSSGSGEDRIIAQRRSDRTGLCLNRHGTFLPPRRHRCPLARVAAGPSRSTSEGKLAIRRSPLHTAIARVVEPSSG